MGIPLSREFLLSLEKCCGNNCINCPYIPRNLKGSNAIKDIEKSSDTECKIK